MGTIENSLSDDKMPAPQANGDKMKKRISKQDEGEHRSLPEFTEFGFVFVQLSIDKDLPEGSTGSVSIEIKGVAEKEFTAEETMVLDKWSKEDTTTKFVLRSHVLPVYRGNKVAIHTRGKVKIDKFVQI